MDFANRFKILRKEKGYTQQQIADLCFLDKSTVCRWEKGDNYPNQQTQSKLADLLGVSIDYLMGRTDMRMISFPSEAVIDMPIIGSVRGGMDGNVVQEETGETRPIAASALHGRPDEYFLLRVRGDIPLPLQSIRNHLNRFACAAGLKRIRIHGFRHSYVSMCAHVGATPLAISKLIGDTVSTVMQVYMHLWADDAGAVVAKNRRDLWQFCAINEKHHNIWCFSCGSYRCIVCGGDNKTRLSIFKSPLFTGLLRLFRAE